LERIREAHGQLTTGLVREEAAPADAVLHPLLTWDAAQALTTVQEIEARRLIRAVIIIDEPTCAEVEAYFHVPAPRGEGHYQPAEVLIERPDEYQLAIAELTRRVQSAEVALRHLERAAQRAPDPDRLLQIQVAMTAFSTAKQAIIALAG
jgi:hypothetical protein